MLFAKYPEVTLTGIRFNVPSPKGTERRLVLREGSMLQGVCDRQVLRGLPTAEPKLG